MKNKTKNIEIILEKAGRGEELLAKEGVILLSQTDPEIITAIKNTADRLRQKYVGDTVTYVVNRNINFTNICEQHCSFCAFRRDPEEKGAFWLNNAQILAKAAEAVKRGATEICIQGGLNPQAKINGQSLPYYLKLIEAIEQEYPQLHIHGFSPQEIQFIAREDKIKYDRVILALKQAGLGSMPGTAAEILDDRIRNIICPEKIDTATWLEIVTTAHKLGMPTTSTMLSGHIETRQQQINHLEKLRSLQQKAIKEQYPAAITEFIILPFVGESAPAALKKRVGRDQPELQPTLLLTAVARLFLGKAIVNHQPSWVKLGLEGAKEALKWGCNDIGGTLMEEHITTMAGAKGGTCMTVETLQEAINSINRPYRERNTVYKYVDNANS
ncbi:MAG: 7,8-didemethyl-8-hydroxy-5-deazariboflavin synthase subunit CofH [Prochloraceae cyanobacterium]|nr:7,8-didemethyl-8-hydroxy-5-deazariboflavin synthase subunit CofH [Prochloraceae cyanobacterium]